MDNQLIAKAAININAPLSKVWDALINTVKPSANLPAASSH